MGGGAMKVIHGLDRAPTKDEITFSQDILGVKFPEAFLNCISQCDQGMTEFDIFNYQNPSNGIVVRETTGSFLSFIPNSESNIVRFFFSQPYFFPNTLMPIMDTGGGDYICFDYSIEGFEYADTPVVLWLHENEEGKEMVDLAINFEEFLKKLGPEPEAETDF